MRQRFGAHDVGPLGQVQCIGAAVGVRGGHRRRAGHVDCGLQWRSRARFPYAALKHARGQCAERRVERRGQCLADLDVVRGLGGIAKRRDRDVIGAGTHACGIVPRGIAVRGDRCRAAVCDGVYLGLRDRRPRAGMGDLPSEPPQIACPGDRGIRVDQSPAIVIVGVRFPEGQRCFLQDRLDLVDGQRGVGLPHQGDQSRDERRGHRGAVLGAQPAAGQRRQDVDAGSADLGFDLAPRRRPAAGESCDTVLLVGRADGKGLAVAARRCDRPARRTVIPGRENHRDPRRAQRLYVGQELLGRGGTAAPRVVDHVRGQGGVAARRQHPLETGVDPAVKGRSLVIKDLGRDPACARRDADPVKADYRAHGVRAVAVPIARIGVPLVCGTEPVALVFGERLARVPPVARLEIGVLPVDAGVHVGHDQPLAGKAQILPHAVRADALHVPLDLFCQLCMGGQPRSVLLGVGQVLHVVLENDRHVGVFCQRPERAREPLDGDAVDDPQRPV